MSSQELLVFYNKRKSDFSASLEKITKRINLISNIRLTVALAFVLLFYFGLKQHELLYLLPIDVIAFVILVRIHGRLFEEKTHLQNLVNLNDAEAKALSGNLSGLNNGSEFIDAHHPYTHDLDIFGEGSLFHWINRCNTLTGKSKFALRLEKPLSSKSEIERNQEAIRELVGKTEFRQHYQAAGKEIDEQSRDREQLKSWLKKPAFLYGKIVYKIILTAVPVITILLVAGWIYSDVFRPWAILMAILQWAFLGFHIRSINDFHEYISKKKNILQKYARLLHFLEEEKFQSQLLNSTSAKAKNADKKVSQLAGLVRALDARLNSMTSLFVNSLLLYDMQCVYRLEKWKEENAAELETWLDAASETEVLCSFGTFAFNHDSFNYAQISDQFSIEATALGHPLIDPSECIVNDLKIGNGPGVLIITGANMAGKSTFLRTIGINLILALNGAPVFASRFQCPIIYLRTGMRTADSLKDHQSYFYAELDRLKGIMDDLRKDIPLLILLDEILKGTNSTDKQAGSIALVKQLLPHPCLGIIATHDLALGDLEKEFPEKVSNFCFEANIENDQLSFDYKLKKGLATKMNATFLMKKMGIIPS